MSATRRHPPGTLRILIVDDETIVRDSLAAWFRQDGHQVDVAEGGKEALRLVSASRYDMAFLDIKMPGMDGLELQARLAAADPELTHRADDRLRLGRDRGQGHEERGLRLHRQALRPRRPLDARQARRRAPLAAGREPAPQAEPRERGRPAAAPRRLARDAARASSSWRPWPPRTRPC